MANYFSGNTVNQDFKIDAMEVLEHVHTLEVDEMCDEIMESLHINDSNRLKVEEFVMDHISLAVRAS